MEIPTETIITKQLFPHLCTCSRLREWFTTCRACIWRLEKPTEIPEISNLPDNFQVYIWASIARYLPPPHPMVMGLYSSAPVPPSPLWCGWCGWWWVVVGGGGWWCTPLPPVVWVVWVVVGGGGRSCICMYMNVSVPPSPLWCGWCGWWWKKLYMYVYECIWWYECIFLVFAYDYDMICIW